jgi:hypothetical protein
VSTDPRFQRYARPHARWQPEPSAEGRGRLTQPTAVASTSAGGSDRLATLLVAGVAAVIAAVVVSRFWQPGTIIGTAATPIIVALVKEWLQRPAERITAVPRRAGHVLRGAHPARPVAPATRWLKDGPERPAFPEPPAPPAAAYTVHRRSRPHWRVAVLTGLVACLAAIAVLTLPELVAGRSLFGHQSTTIFGGGTTTRHVTKVITTTTTTTLPKTTTTTTVPATATTTTAPPTVTTTTPPATTTAPAATATSPPATTTAPPAAPPSAPAPPSGG